ncbi:hypothetical protein KUV85_07490 [Nocardioides panacisoli]|uniref:hypothetical protein n=1 Tax=Nocardioides panacisoli TaxID=627624 RepID=UPI001C62A3B3|nr:hypothetical protein [Nocardioides panacisoli]QYJ05511.1 hypothetical protein KUV85_07490 [Nocardioides panacisoli]
MANSHKRDLKISRRRTAAIAAPLAAATTVATIAVGVLGNEDEGDATMAIDTSQFSGSVADTSDRGEVLSRSGSDRDRAEIQDGKTIKLAPTKADKMMRPQQVKSAVNGADTNLWTTEVLNLWTRPDGKADKVGEVDEVEKVLVTGRELGDREEIVVEGKSRWVTAGYLDEEKPVAQSGTGGTCSNGTSVPAGVSSNIRAIHQAVCSRWAQISTYGTLRGGGGDHGAGRAVDIMVSGATGWEVAEYVRANASALGVKYVIYSQQIWSVERGGEGWRGMSDRGSTTANHFDHVHVSTF